MSFTTPIPTSMYRLRSAFTLARSHCRPDSGSCKIMLIGAPPLPVAIYELMLQGNTPFHHGNVRLPIRVERLLNQVLVTPRMHGIHHSMVERENSSNFSVVFPFWDLLRRTLALNVPQQEIVVGIPAYDAARDNGLGRLLLLPFRIQCDPWRRPDGTRVRSHDRADGAAANFWGHDGGHPLAQQRWGHAMNRATFLKVGRKGGLCALGILALSSATVLAAEPAVQARESDAAMVDAIIRKMESSGALDAAVDRAIDRYVQRKESARQAEEARQQAELKDRAKLARPIDVKQDHIRGTPAADVSLIEYTDFECPFCKQFHATPKVLLDRYGGRVNWVIRNYPLPFHDPAARREAIASECIARLGGNDAYWKYADALFANTKSNGAGLPDDKSIEKLAELVGIKRTAFGQCMSDEAAVKRVEQDIADGTAAGVTGTPATVVRNNRTGASEAVVGALPADGFTAAIERMLEAKP